MRTADIRSGFLSYFEQRGHRVLPSSSLVPANDPTLLFTNSGMVQFKEALLGRDRPGYRRAASCQRCVRAGGKHNDLENVGYTARHLTFFEMLGNFSFGDYFKEQAIAWAWEFSLDELDLDPERIWVAVHPEDHESREIWKRVTALPHDRIVNEADNFWSMGDSGPCGRNSELFYDQGPGLEGGPPGSPGKDGDRFVEYWNLVFPQFDRSADGTIADLANPGVDTGMGLERVAAIKQGVLENYGIDIFRPVVEAVCELARVKLGKAPVPASVKVIADHIRSTALLIADGVIPSNEDRGYVLRRIMRRALRHGHKLGMTAPFFHRLVSAVSATLGDAYPELKTGFKAIEAVVEREEQRFAETLDRGMNLLEAEVDTCGGGLSGQFVFRLYDTYGFPLDLTADVAREKGLAVDVEGFDRCMEEQRARARAHARFDASLEQTVTVDGDIEFVGYDDLESAATVVSLLTKDAEWPRAVTELGAGTPGIVMLDRTPMYSEAGGQVGDSGVIGTEHGKFRVSDTQCAGSQSLHHGEMELGTLKVGEVVLVSVDKERRARIAKNHSATHLLNAALKEVLGAQVRQKGSLVAPDRLRFDFTNPSPLTSDQVGRIEVLVNDQIFQNTPVITNVEAFEDAIKDGAVALAGEAYGDEVRVLSMGDGFSRELCGGTHVRRTGDIGMFKIISESSISAGVRRVEALTGPGLFQWVAHHAGLVRSLGEQLNVGQAELPPRIATLVESLRRAEERVRELDGRLVKLSVSDWAAKAERIEGVGVLAREVAPDQDPLTLLDQLRSRLGESIVVLAQVRNGKASLVCGVSRSIAGQVSARDLVAHLSELIGARGGGSPTMARAGGGDPKLLPGALDQVGPWARTRLVPVA